jgi:nitrogen fixation NifU-like protein
MSELGDLYQEVILDHNKRPRNFRALPGADHRAVGHNPLCGDRMTIYLKLDGDVVTEVTFEGSGCAISKASASMMTESIKGKTRAQVEALFKKFHGLVTGEPPASGADLGKLVVFSGVSEFPVRVKCATLAWHTLRAALEERTEAVSTE